MRPHRKTFGYGYTVLVILAVFALALPAMACGEGWYDQGWNNRKAVTIDHTKVVTDQKDFPVLINVGNDPDLAAYAQGTGGDLVFTLSDGKTKIPHEIESFTKSNGALQAYVKLPTVSASSDTVVYMYYGNSGASDQQDRRVSTWHDIYQGKWRKKEIASWIQTQYNNHNNPSSFHRWGPPEWRPVDPTPTPTPTPTVTPTPTPTVPPDTPTQTTQWTDCGWNYRKGITIDHTKVLADQKDFPVLVNLISDPSLAARAQTSGNDLLFTLGDQKTKVPHKIETFTSTTGALMAWVKVPLLSSSSDTVLYMYYGNPNAPAQEDTSSWCYRYKGTWNRDALKAWVQTKYNNQANTATFYSVGSETLAPQSCSVTPTCTPTPTPTATPTATPTPTATGTLTIDSVPTGAQVYVDGTFAGTGPVTVTVAAGSHTVKLTLTGYTDYTASVDVLAGGSFTQTYTLAAKGTLVIDSVPTGAQVYVDGTLAGTAPVTVAVDAGTHSVELTQTGYNDYTASVDVAAGATVSQTYTLTALSSTLTINSVPTGAQVYVDGVLAGTAPVTVPVKVGTHSVKLTLAGYTDYTASVDVAAGAAVTETYTLKAKGTLVIDSVPIGAQVSIDGVVAGTAPVTVAVDGGTHAVLLTLTGYQDSSASIDVPAGGSVSQVYTLIFTCPANPDTYSLVRSDNGETVGCVAITDDWNGDGGSSILGTLYITDKMANNYCLASADEAIGLDANPVDPQNTWTPSDPSICTQTNTFAIDIPATYIEFPGVWITSHAMVQKQGETVSHDALVPENPTYFPF